MANADQNRMPVSNYGRVTNAGDTAIELVAAGAHNPQKGMLYAANGTVLFAVPPQLDDTDKLAVSLYITDASAGNATLKTANQASDGNTGINAIMSGQYLFNTSTFDVARGTYTSVILASAARTIETNSADQTNYNAKALILFVNVSAIVDTPILTPTLQIKDSISGNYFTIWTAAATIAATGQYAYLFDVGGVGGAGSFTEAVNIRVGRTWRLKMTVADADSATYSVSAENLL